MKSNLDLRVGGGLRNSFQFFSGPSFEMSFKNHVNRFPANTTNGRNFNIQTKYYLATSIYTISIYPVRKESTQNHMLENKKST